MYKLQDLKLGQKESFSVSISKTMHQTFIETIQDTSPIHTSDAFAQSFGFTKKIAFGFHIASFLSKLYGTLLPGGSSLCLKQEITFLKPVYIGDTIFVEGEVTAINTQLKLVTIKNVIKNQNNEVCLTGTGILKMMK